MKNRTKWKMFAIPKFADVTCPLCNRYMIELENGWIDNPVWWCNECKDIYQMELHRVNPTKYGIEKVSKQLEELRLKEYKLTNEEK